jgi:uncharacterized protein (DUF2249 family)
MAVKVKGGKMNLNVRTLIPLERHVLIFKTLGELAPGEAFELVRDHNLKPLQSRFQNARSRQLSSEYLERAPEVWRLKIGRV